ncbi:MAG: hypothetical protein Q9167_005476 [Letrouitia subvulpina]
MSCRVAGANSPAQLFENLASSKDVRREIDRFNSVGYYKPSGGPRKGLTNVRHAYLLDEGIDRFDNEFFAIPAIEAEAIDPQQRLLLELAYEAIENAGIPLEKIQGTDTAVYTGLFTNDYGTSLLRDVDFTPKYQSTGTSNSMAANRISYFFDLRGPSMVLDTACSSTLAALHQALNGLKAKESEMALVCGANLILNPDMVSNDAATPSGVFPFVSQHILTQFIHMSELGFLSPDGTCKSFDASGNGYARGEGVLALLIKPLAYALRDNDPIRSVIKATRMNQDGRTNGITLPSSEAQRWNMQALYANSKLSPGDIQYLEAHGTGTKVGDPIELSAVDSIFGAYHSEQPLIVGSAKSNVGHLEACAAIVGVIKTVECLERGQIPAQKHFINPNPNVNFTSINIPTSLINWPPTKNGIRRAAVNSFGFGGTNCHAVLEYFPLTAPVSRETSRPFLFKISAASEFSLQRLATIYADYVSTSQPTLDRLAYTLFVRRSTLKKSLFLIATNHGDFVEKLRSCQTGSTRIYSRVSLPSQSIGFVFTGQGAQWAGMGKQLCTHSAIFADVINQCDHELSLLSDKPEWSIREEMCKPAEASRLSFSIFSQPVCTAMQLGLVELFKQWGIRPTAVFGHSSGEIGAAYAAGFLSLRDSIVTAYYRGLHLKNAITYKASRQKGAMCAVGLGKTAALDFIKLFEGRVALAAVNSPSNCTLSGDSDAISCIVDHCKERGIFCRALQVDTAYHSHHMLPLAPLYEKSLRAAGVSPLVTSLFSKCEMFSSVTGRKLLPSECGPIYWVENMVSTVRFTAALAETVKCHNLGALVEIGPHPALKGPTSDTLAAIGRSEVDYFPSCNRNKPDLVALLEMIAGFVNAGLPMNTEAINRIDTENGRAIDHALVPPLTDLPTYQWDHSASHWAETRVSKNLRFRQFPRHQLLGSRLSNDNPLNPTWRNMLRRKEVDWLEKLMDEGTDFLPKTSYILMALEAAEQIWINLSSDTAPTGMVRLNEVSFPNKLSLSALENENGVIETQVSLRASINPQRFYFAVSASPEQHPGNWKHLCTGSLDLSDTCIQAPSPPEEMNNDSALLEYIQSLEVYPTRNFENLHLKRGQARGSLVQGVDENEHYHLNPALFASLERLPDMLLSGTGPPAEYSLEAIESVEMPLGRRCFQKVRFDVVTRRISPIQGLGELQLYDTEGVKLILRGMSSRVLRILERKPPLKSLFFERIIRPDISFMKSAESLLLCKMLKLVTHKWPMADIAAVQIDDEDLDAVKVHLQGICKSERAHFRSLSVLSNNDGSQIGRIRFIKAFDSNKRYHLLLVTAQSLTSNISHIGSDAFACVKVDGSEDRDLFDNYLDLICKIEGFPNGHWLFGRPKPLQNGVVVDHERLVICASDQCDVASFREHADFEYVRISKNQTQAVQSIEQNLSKGVNIIVIDCAPKSMLVGWRGSELLPWIQILLESARNLLWVTNRIDRSPFIGLAGAFIRTIRSEYPSLKASCLEFKDSPFVPEVVIDVYHAMLQENSELEISYQQGQICALRYQPDDDLSASVALEPPKKSTRDLESQGYEVSLIKQREIALLSHRQRKDTSGKNYVHVATEASLIDCEDVQAFVGISHSKTEYTGLGQFFAGKVIFSNENGIKSGDYVVGWQPGAHKSSIVTPSSHLLLVPERMPLLEALIHFAAYMVALTIICEIARARKGEVIDIRVYGVLGEALSNICRQLGIRTFIQSANDADFIVSWNYMQGFCVNGRGFLLRKLLAYEEIRHSIIRNIWDHQPLHSHYLIFKLGDIQAGFEKAQANPLTTLISYERPWNANDYLVSYDPPENLFCGDSSYIVLGGLGGLGRYTLTWMVSKGAKHLVTLSRSGLRSKAAQETAETIEQLGAEIQVFEVDACNLSAVGAVLAEVRAKRPIRGCFNMVLLLDNSPFNTMAGEQWDQVISSKVQSTWNLHQATLCDELEIFIMFSSVSSISGNRTQANYAVGNAFQNSMAEFRRQQGLPGIAIALGAMHSIGILADDHELLRALAKNGLQALGPEELRAVLEAAVMESYHGDRQIISTGFEMFETLDGIVQARPDQTELFWTEWPEFSFLLDHKFSTAVVTKVVPLFQQITDQTSEAAHNSLVQAFLGYLSNILGYQTSNIDPKFSLASYGLDSLNALKIDVPIFEVLGCKSIHELITRVLNKIDDQSKRPDVVSLPIPIHHNPSALAIRPISHSQSRLWFLHRFLEDKTIHNLLLVCHISGQVNILRFQKAWTLFVQRHEVLHSQIIDTPSGLQQIPSDDPHFDLTVVNATEANFESSVKRVVETARSWVFNLEAGKLIRGWLLTSPVGWRFFLTSHHLAWDRASVATIFDETVAIYKSLVNGKSIDALTEPKFQFVDYALWQNSWMNQHSLVEPHIKYWTNQLAGVPDAVSLLPTALLQERPKQKQYGVDSIMMTTGSGMITALKDFCRQMAVTPFMFMSSALAALIYRWTRDSDIVIGIADGDRGHTEFDRLVGFTVNMLAIRSKITGDAPFSKHVEDYRKTCLEAYEHRALPFDYLLQKLKIPWRTSHSPLFQISVNYQLQGTFPECDYGDFKFTNYDHYNARSQSDLMLNIEETLTGEMNCILNFDTTLYDSVTISNFANSFQQLVGNVLMSNGEVNVDDIGLVSTEDQRFISSALQPNFNDGPLLEDLDNELFPDLFNKAVANGPRKPAIIDGAKIATYAELDVATSRIASFLTQIGLQAGQRVGVCCEQGVEMVFAMYGIIRAGCAYVPIDPDFPEERMSSMIEDADVKAVLVDNLGDRKHERLATCDIISSSIYLIGELCTTLVDAKPPQVRDFKRLPLCCIFTSGSTGRPKGILLGHRQLRYQMEGYHNYVSTGSNDILLLSSAMVFDMLEPEDAERSEIPLGKPLFPSRFHILDNHLNPVPVGFCGELYIGGLTVNKEYLKREEITAEAFLKDPFASMSEIEAGHGRLYRTKDAFRLLPNGDIQSVGRISGDRQVKIRGMRTELDEIENAIYNACRALEDEEGTSRVPLAAVVYHIPGSIDGVLAAYLECPHSSEAQQASLASFLRLRLKASLPVHMIPSAFVILENLPRTVSEKIDYKTIYAWEAPMLQSVTSPTLERKSEPLNPLQSTIASVWRSTLHLTQDLSPADEVFALGGHSLTLIHLRDGIRENCQVTIQLADMFANPTIEGMEKLILAEQSKGVILQQNTSPTSGPYESEAFVNGNTTGHELIDWEEETSLPLEIDFFVQPAKKKSTSTVAITGACTMAGAHLIHHILLNSSIRIECIGAEGHSNQEARSGVLASLERWRLLKDLSSSMLEQLNVYCGGLAHPTLGLTPRQIDLLDVEVDAIFQLDSDVSLFKRYDNLRDTNIGPLKFLISLAYGKVNNTKPIYYLSTWGVPHLQAWKETQLRTPKSLTSEAEMTNMTPGRDGSLGYLKARWACEAILYKAARHGVPVSIFRSCMCSSSPGSGIPLDRTDINRRILECSLETGMVPDFSSDRGGGMSWITADFLVQSMFHLLQRHVDLKPEAKIYHIVNREHIPYNKLANLLAVSHEGKEMRTVQAEVWFDALRAKPNPEMTLLAEVLESWCLAGWVPFQLEAKNTLQILKKEKGLVPLEISRELLMELVVGNEGF